MRLIIVALSVWVFFGMTLELVELIEMLVVEDLRMIHIFRIAVRLEQ